MKSESTLLPSPSSPSLPPGATKLYSVWPVFRYSRHRLQRGWFSPSHGVSGTWASSLCCPGLRCFTCVGRQGHLKGRCDSLAQHRTRVHVPQRVLGARHSVLERPFGSLQRAKLFHCATVSSSPGWVSPGPLTHSFAHFFHSSCPQRPTQH